jgi:hypothetical protein
MHGDERSAPLQFDPAVLAAFLRAQETFRDIFESFAAPTEREQRSMTEGTPV